MIATLDRLYQQMSPLMLRTDAQTAHHRFLEILRTADIDPLLSYIAATLGRWTMPHAPTTVGGVSLPHPFILSAGLVKGDGFETENAALARVDAGYNIIPGLRTMPALVGPVEFGSFTRHPRVGNPGTVIWRDKTTRSTQNRIGLRNPGAKAAAAFLARHADDLPAVYGVNIAVTPGVDDPDQETQDALDSLAAFQAQGIRPAWYTLNLSCPNTEDDPAGNQTDAKARQLCDALTDTLDDIPLWVKVGPGLSHDQYAALMAAFADTGVSAVIATNTLPAPTPDGTHTAGLGGGRLHASALAATEALQNARRQSGAAVDIIGCGGVLDGDSYHAFTQRGAGAVMYYTALIYRSPLAAAFIAQEAGI